MKTNRHHEHNVTGIVQPTETYDGHDVVLICPAIVTLTNQTVRLTVNNTSSLPCTIPKGTHLATFSVLSPGEHRELRPVNPVVLSYLNVKDPKYSYEYVNELLRQPRNQGHRRPLLVPNTRKSRGPLYPYANTSQNSS